MNKIEYKNMIQEIKVSEELKLRIIDLEQGISQFGK